MRIHYRMVGADGWSRHSDLPAVPREGEAVYDESGEIYRVKTVVYYPWGVLSDETAPEVYVVLRSA